MLGEAILIGILTSYTVIVSSQYSATWGSERRDLFISRSEDQFQSQMDRLHRKPWSSGEIKGRYSARFENLHNDREIRPIDFGRAIESRPNVQKYRKGGKQRFLITNNQPQSIENLEKGHSQVKTTSPIIESID